MLSGVVLRSSSSVLSPFALAVLGPPLWPPRRRRTPGIGECDHRTILCHTFERVASEQWHGHRRRQWVPLRSRPLQEVSARGKSASDGTTDAFRLCEREPKAHWLQAQLETRVPFACCVQVSRRGCDALRCSTGRLAASSLMDGKCQCGHHNDEAWKRVQAFDDLRRRRQALRPRAAHLASDPCRAGKGPTRWREARPRAGPLIRFRNSDTRTTSKRVFAHPLCTGKKISSFHTQRTTERRRRHADRPP